MNQVAFQCIVPMSCLVFASVLDVHSNAQQSPGMWSLSAHYQQILHQKGTPYASNPLDQPDKPRQITYVTMTNERWKWMVRGHVGPNPGSPQWNEYKTELYPVPNLWLMDPRRSGIDRWSLLTARLPLWEILLHRVWKQNLVFRDYSGTVSLDRRALNYSLVLGYLRLLHCTCVCVNSSKPYGTWTPYFRVILEKLIAYHLVNVLPAFVGFKESLPYLHLPSNGPCNSHGNPNSTAPFYF